MYYLGIDVGSVSAKCVLLDSLGKIKDKIYLKNESIIETIKKCLKEFSKYKVSSVAVTGSGRELVAKMVGADMVVSEVMAHGTASLHYFPKVLTVIDIGGEDSKLILVKNGQIDDFVMNTDCGGGTGAMIEAVCQRLGVKLEAVGETALSSTTELSLPSKCGVFCQSAIVSKKNMGVPANDLLMGVCRGIVVNYLAILGKGKEFKSPIMFQGACAKNKALVKAFEKELKSEIIVPSNCEFMGAIGAALLTVGRVKKTQFKGFEFILNSDFITTAVAAQGCPNKCELTKLHDGEKSIAIFGNRCEKCI